MLRSKLGSVLRASSPACRKAISFLGIALLVTLLCLASLADTQALIESDGEGNGRQGVPGFSVASSSPGEEGSQGGSSGDNRAGSAGKLLSLGTVTVYVSPASSTKLVGEVFTVEVRANAGSDQVNTADVAMSYSTTYLDVQSITPGSALNTLITATAGGGTVSYIAGLLTDPPSYATGDFLLFSLQIRALTPVASTTLSFGSVAVASNGAGHTVTPQNGAVTILAATETPTPTNTPVATQVPSPTATQPCPPGQQELVLRQGVDGYTGFADTYINSWDPPENYHTDQHLRLRPDVERILIRADLTTLSPGHVITRAILTLYQGKGIAHPLQSDVYEVLRPWEVEETTWLEAADMVSWDQDGCDGLGTDRAANPTYEREIFPTSGGYEDYPFDFDVTALVHQWVNDPMSNHGLIIAVMGGPSVEYEFRSSKYWSLDARPRLVICYGVGPTPTPTPTATPTETPTPTGGTVQGTVFDDLNGNDSRDAGEAGVPGTTVELRGITDPGFSETEVSGAQGQYSFADVEPGTYQMSVIAVPPGYEWGAGTPYPVTVSAGEVEEIDIPLSRSHAMYLPMILRESV